MHGELLTYFIKFTTLYRRSSSSSFYYPSNTHWCGLSASCRFSFQLYRSMAWCRRWWLWQVWLLLARTTNSKYLSAISHNDITFMTMVWCFVECKCAVMGSHERTANERVFEEVFSFSPSRSKCGERMRTISIKILFTDLFSSLTRPLLLLDSLYWRLQEPV